MLNINTINQTIINTDYGWNLPSLAILVPGLSFYVQTMKVQNILRSYIANFDPNKDVPMNYALSFQGSQDCVKIDKIYKWNAIVTAIEAIVFKILGATVSPLFFIPMALMWCQFIVILSAVERQGVVQHSMVPKVSKQSVYLEPWKAPWT